MDWLNADYHNLSSVLIGLALCLLAFGWSAIFWYAARMLGELKKSVDGLHISVAKLFERYDGQADDIRELKKRMARIEVRK